MAQGEKWGIFGTAGIKLFVVLFICIYSFPLITHADAYTRENFLFSYHYKPVSFTGTMTNGFTGTLENGSAFVQVPIVTDPSVRIHKFVIDDAFFYISDRGTFQAANNLTAVSIYSYLANA